MTNSYYKNSEKEENGNYTGEESSRADSDNDLVNQ